MSDNNVIDVGKTQRPEPNPRNMRDDALIVIDLLLGVERLCDSGDGYTESIRALAVAACTKLEFLKTDIERMME